MSDHKPFKPPMPTAPQPEVLPRETNAIMEALEIRESELLDRIAALEASNGNAFVSGAAWMGGFSADFSAKQAARAEAERRGFVFKASRETFLESKIATLEAELAEAQERLAMAVEALKESDHRIWEHHEVGHIERAAHRAWGKACEICSKESPTIFARNQAVLDATAAFVAQHTAEVEARAIQKCQRCVTPQQLAEIMHETYERQALIEGWTTQESCRVPFAELPEANKRVMLAVAKAVLWATPDLSKMEAEVERRGAAKRDRRREVKLGVIEFHSDRLNPGLRQRFYEVVDDLKRSGSIVDVWLLDISRVLAEFGYEMHVYSSVEPDNSTVARAAELEGA